jgi:hypothetical protein
MMRAIVREMPDGSARRVYPFHVSLEGLKKAIICRDEEDYDVMVKYVFLCAMAANVRVVTYVVVSNHLHVILLAENYEHAKACGDEIRRRYAMWFSYKYHERRLYHDKCVDVQWIDTEWYLRNAIAYVFRNALDNGDSVESYPWSGYRALFCRGRCKGWTRPVTSLTKRERETIFHTNDSLLRVPWLIDAEGCLEPVSATDYAYVEEVFNGSQAFLLKTIGTVNMAEMNEKLVDGPRTRLLDGDFFKLITSISDRWFSKPVSALVRTEHARLIPNIYRTTNTSIPQLARGFGISREEVADILRQNK